MEEVQIRIRFETPCLGSRRTDENPLCSFARSGDNVIFMPTWWRDILRYGARATSPSIAVELMDRVVFSPKVEGEVVVFRRHYVNRGEHGYQDHEAFVGGQVVTVRAMLPDHVSRDDLYRVLLTAGPYCGISPYGKDAMGFGRFTPVDVLRVGAAHDNARTDTP